MSLDDCEKLFERINSASDISLLRALFRKLLKEQPLLSYEYGPSHIFWRGRHCDSEAGFSTLSEVAYPCRTSVRAGRLNDDDEPMLYGASQLITVLNELSVQRGNCVHYIGFTIKPGSSVRLGVVGEQYHIYHTGLSPLLGNVPDKSIQKELNKLGVEYLPRVVYVDAFLRTVLSDKRAERSAYAHTRALAKEIFRSLSSVEGFFYPSTKHDVGVNLVVTPSCFDNKFKVVTSSVLKVDKVREFGMYDFHKCTNICAVEDGVFQKTKPMHVYGECYFNMEEDEHRHMQEKHGIRGIPYSIQDRDKLSVPGSTGCLRGAGGVDFLPLTKRNYSTRGVPAMKRFRPLILTAAGLFLFLGGFVYDVEFAGIPYQDPTREMSAHYAHHAHVASAIRWVGVGVFLFGVLYCIIRLAARRYRSRIAGNWGRAPN